MSGASGKSFRGVADCVRDVLDISGVGFKIRHLDHAQVESAVGRFLDLCSEYHVFPDQRQVTARCT